MIDKAKLRSDLKRRRSQFVASIPDSVRALLFSRPPAAIAERVPEGAVISVFHEMPGEVPASNYARWFRERGHRIALPWLAARGGEMLFREWVDPFAEDGLVPDPYQALQPPADAALLVPDVMFCPLLGFNSTGGRIGYGAGFFDRWLEAHRPALAIGLAWDCQLDETIPIEAHDQPLDLVVTQSRVYGPFA